MLLYVGWQCPNFVLFTISFIPRRNMMPLKKWPVWQKLMLVCIGCGGIAYGIALIIELFIP